MNFPGGNHLCTEISSNQDAFPRRKSSLHRNFFESGCNSLGGIIPAEQFRRIRMNFSAGNHPWRAIPPNQDAFLRRESSLQSNSVKSGCISPAEIIPAQKFLQIRMHSSGRKSSQTSNSAENWCQPYQEWCRPYHDFRYWLGVIPSTFLKIREK